MPNQSSRCISVVLVHTTNSLYRTLRVAHGLHVSLRWADVPTTKHPELFFTSDGCAHGSPTVKYRGIFLNDEQPCLQNWAMEKFTNGTGSPLLNSPFNHDFYTKLWVYCFEHNGHSRLIVKQFWITFAFEGQLSMARWVQTLWSEFPTLMLATAMWSRYVELLSEWAITGFSIFLSAFGMDDPLNQFYADIYGIVMGTRYAPIEQIYLHNLNVL